MALADTYFRSQGIIFYQNHLYISDSLYSGHLALAYTYFRSQGTDDIHLEAPGSDPFIHIKTIQYLFATLIFLVEILTPLYSY